MDKEFLIESAFRKYQKFCEENGYGVMHCSRDDSGCENHEGKEYVILRNTTQILSVWLVKDGDKLSRVDDEDLPKSLLEEICYTS